MGNVVLVTGATGKVGRSVVSQLLDRDVSVRALARNPEAARLPEGVEVVRGDLSEPDSVAAAMDGVDAAFLLWPFLGLGIEAATPVVDVAAKQARRIVVLSSQGVRDDVEQQGDPNSQFHADLEDLIERSGAEWTFLRPGGFAGNTLEWAPQVRAEGVVRAPFGAMGRPLIHERDIAAVGVRALTEDGHAGAKYALTGPEVVTQLEQAHAIGVAIGRPVRFEEQPLQDARAEMLDGGWPPWMVDAALEAWGEMVTNPEPVTRTVEEVTGAPAHTFREWAVDHADDFR